jgi:hypothetical protein
MVENNLVEQRRVELLASALRTAKSSFMDSKTRVNATQPDKSAPRTISTAMNYDPERPILTELGNVLATGN